MKSIVNFLNCSKCCNMKMQSFWYQFFWQINFIKKGWKDVKEYFIVNQEKNYEILKWNFWVNPVFKYTYIKNSPAHECQSQGLIIDLFIIDLLIFQHDCILLYVCVQPTDQYHMLSQYYMSGYWSLHIHWSTNTGSH